MRGNPRCVQPEAHIVRAHAPFVALAQVGRAIHFPGRVRYGAVEGAVPASNAMGLGLMGVMGCNV